MASSAGRRSKPRPWPTTPFASKQPALAPPLVGEVQAPTTPARLAPGPTRDLAGRPGGVRATVSPWRPFVFVWLLWRSWRPCHCRYRRYPSPSRPNGSFRLSSTLRSASTLSLAKIGLVEARLPLSLHRRCSSASAHIRRVVRLAWPSVTTCWGRLGCQRPGRLGVLGLLMIGSKPFTPVAVKVTAWSYHWKCPGNPLRYRLRWAFG